MEVSHVVSDYNYISKQRNLFLCLLVLVSISLVLVSLRLFTTEQRIIMVPGLEKEISVSNYGASSSYLELTTYSFLSSLLDITPTDISYKKNLVLRHTIGDEHNTKAINEYFQKVEEKYKKFDLSTHYTAKHLEINQKDMTVVAKGILTSWFGKGGHETKEVSYKLSYVFTGNQLKLKEFVKIAKEVKK